MKIFYITSVLGDIGGSEIYARDVILELAANGHRICVATTEPYDFSHKNIEVFKIPSFGHHAFHKFTAPLFYFSVAKKAREFEPDIVQSHSNSIMGWIGSRIKRELKIPHVLLIEMISAQNNNLHTKTIFALEKFLLPRLDFDAVVVWTQNMKKKFLLPWGVKAEKIFVIPAALDQKNYDVNASGKKVREKYGSNLIVTMKSLWTTNVLGLAYIVKAMKFVKQKHPEFRYLCVGPGDSSPLQKLAKENGVEDVIVFTGAIPNNEKQAYWAAADIAPHSFVYEFSTAISLLEFMAMGRPCVITDTGAVREFVGDAALIVKEMDEQAMADGIIELIEDKKLRETLGKKARRLFEEQYSIASTAKRLEEIYSQAQKNEF